MLTAGLLLVVEGPAASAALQPLETRHTADVGRGGAGQPAARGTCLQLTLFLRVLFWHVCFPSLAPSPLLPCLLPLAPPLRRATSCSRAAGALRAAPLWPRSRTLGCRCASTPTRHTCPTCTRCATHIMPGPLGFVLCWQANCSYTRPRPRRGVLLAMSAIQLTSHRHRPPLVLA